jgi:hypothetical protein
MLGRRKLLHSYLLHEMLDVILRVIVIQFTVFSGNEEKFECFFAKTSLQNCTERKEFRQNRCENCTWCKLGGHINLLCTHCIVSCVIKPWMELME